MKVCHAPKRDSGAYARLSARETEVLQLIAEGKTTSQIAAALHVSIKTIETHRAHIMAKLNLKNVAGTHQIC